MKNFDPKKPSKFITYLDINNVYGWAMSGYLPNGGFKWFEKWWWVWCRFRRRKESIGYILDVDLEYPDELHVIHNDYSLASEKLAVSYDMPSNFC